MKNKQSIKKRLSYVDINVILFGIVSFLNDFSGEMIVPILPMLITSLGGSGIIIGLAGGLRDSVANILKVVSGYFSDKLGKRNLFVFSGYLTAAVFKIFIALAKTWQQLLFFIGIERIGKGLRDAPRDAIIAEKMPIHRGRGFGIHRTMHISGAICGSLASFILFYLWDFSFKTIIFTATGIGFLTLIPFLFIKEKENNVSSKKQKAKIIIKKLSRTTIFFIIISAVFSLANFSYMFFILKVQSAIPGKTSMAAPLLLYVLRNIFYAAFAIPLGNLSDKIGRKKVILSGYLLFSLICLGFAIFNDVYFFTILFALYGIVYAIIDTNLVVFVSELSATEIHATAIGTFYTITGMATLLSSLIAGILWQKISPTSTFVWGSILSIIAAILLFFFNEALPDLKPNISREIR